MIKNFFIFFSIFFVFIVCLSAGSDDFNSFGSMGGGDGDFFGKSQDEAWNSWSVKESEKYKTKESLFDSWLNYSSFDFDVYYYNDVVVRDVLANIDGAYNLIVKDLNYVFFYSPQRIKIYIYKNQNEYVSKTDGGGWSGGYADVRKNAIYTFEQRDLMEDVLVHELTHLVFDSYMGFPRNMSINWIHEGLAVYEEKRFFDKKWNLKYLKMKDQEGLVYSLKDAFKTASGLEKDTSKISLWYLQMGTVIYYLFTLDKEGFKVFCENLKIYKNVDEAIKLTYPWEFHSVDGLDKAWRKWLYDQGDAI